MEATTPERVSLFQWGCLGLLLSFIVAAVAAGIWLMTKSPASPSGPRPTAIIWTATPTPTPVPSATPTPLVLQPGELGVGSRVQVSGTGSAGLSIRASASTTGERLEVAAEGQAFLVVEGPVQADGLEWWKVRDEADPEREGWAAATYLVLAED